jgi:hypothetical protein
MACSLVSYGAIIRAIAAALDPALMQPTGRHELEV